eukprot:10701436-Alexandrium_andersonii.AAC.1
MAIATTRAYSGLRALTRISRVTEPRRSWSWCSAKGPAAQLPRRALEQARRRGAALSAGSNWLWPGRASIHDRGACRAQ